MRKLKMLKPDSYPTLRWSLFCGEPLPVEVAQAFAAAAPGSIVENLYGPTELTIACTLYRWDAERSPAESALGVVPIGTPYPGMTAIVVGEDLREVAPGEDGELLLTGPQMTLGYWRDPEKTAAAFVVPPGRERDLLPHRRPRAPPRRRRPDDLPAAASTTRSRCSGHRVELGEIESVMREESGVDAVVAVGWPPTPAGVGGIVAFIGDLDVDVRRADASASAAGSRPTWSPATCGCSPSCR